jgi:hypothetical protein
MTSLKSSRKRIGQALGLLALGLVLVLGGVGYGQSQDQPVNTVPLLTNANGGLSGSLFSWLQLSIDFVVDRPKPAANPSDKLLRNTQVGVVIVGTPGKDKIERVEDIKWIETCAPATWTVEPYFRPCVGAAAVASSHSNADTSLQQNRVLFARWNKFKVEISGGVTTLKSPLTDEPTVRQNVLYMTDLVVHELKLKVGETFTLAPDALPKLKEVSNPLRNPEIRFNTKPEVAEAKVVQKEGEVFGAIEFTAKAKGEAMILIDYDLFSQIAQVVLSQARLQVNVMVE